MKTLLGGVISGQQEWRRWEGMRVGTRWYLCSWSQYRCSVGRKGVSRQAWNFIPWDRTSKRGSGGVSPACSCPPADSGWPKGLHRSWAPLHFRVTWPAPPGSCEQKGMASEPRNRGTPSAFVGQSDGTRALELLKVLPQCMWWKLAYSLAHTLKEAGMAGSARRREGTVTAAGLPTKHIAKSRRPWQDQARLGGI